MTAEDRGGKTVTPDDKEARLAGLYDEYYDRLAHYAYVRIGDKNEAEDIASETFVKALESVKKYRERGVPMQAWLFKIAHNLVVDHLRRVSKHKTVPMDTIEIRAGADPEAAAEMSAQLESVAVALRSLTEEQREVVRLRFFGGLTSREVGALLGKSDGAVREMQRAALEKLRRLLGEDTPLG